MCVCVCVLVEMEEGARRASVSPFQVLSRRSEKARDNRKRRESETTRRVLLPFQRRAGVVEVGNPLPSSPGV